MALFNEANQGQRQPEGGAWVGGAIPPSDAPPSRPSTQNERIMDLIQRMAEKDKQIQELADAMKRIAAFVGLPM